MVNLREHDSLQCTLGQRRGARAGVRGAQGARGRVSVARRREGGAPTVAVDEDIRARLGCVIRRRC